ncbi:Golgi nucleoside diphosphatase [Silvibacterium bohemicum]|uniref:Golgi nucleoside diphosphatase n=1 Tax=Silvibacterium bohemicum TaxID=1577686 RepID=A0A841JT87_9BACT|nr:hypothetical protein [Silvibacterium bohemicum]MBB6142161.1 Golgi nucleoside diphosphatase [Silvibacterium bohemicum]
MFESTLATAQDAELILKLYKLRTESTMREARKWVVCEFFPDTPEQVTALQSNISTTESAWLRQVCSYWDMAAAFVLHGALNAELFLDCNTEPFFLYAKFQPLLPEIRKKSPRFFVKVEQIIAEYPAAQAQVDLMTQGMPSRKAAAQAEKDSSPYR